MFKPVDIAAELDTTQLSFLLTPFDLKRLDAYANNTLDYHVIMDLLPTVASLYFEKRLGSDIGLSAVQSSMLLGLGLQRKTVEAIEVSIKTLMRRLISSTHGFCFQSELQLPVSQILALLVKIVKKISRKLIDIQKAAISAELPVPNTAVNRVDGDNTDGRTNWKPIETSIQAELDDAGDEVTRGLKERQRELIDSLDLQRFVCPCHERQGNPDMTSLRFAIDTTSADWNAAEAQLKDASGAGKATVISVKSDRGAGQKRKSNDSEAMRTKQTRRGKKHKRS